MRKVLFFGVVLLLIVTLPTALAKPHYYYPTVTFEGDLVGEADLETWPAPPSSKIVIELEPINLTFQDRDGEEGSDWNMSGFEWDYFEWLSRNWLPYYENCFGKLYLRVLKNKGEATIKYYFGPIDKTVDPYGQLFRYRLVGSGTWSGARIEVEDKSFTIYNVTYTEKKNRLRTKFDPLWSGYLTFDITVGPV